MAKFKIILKFLFCSIGNPFTFILLLLGLNLLNLRSFVFQTVSINVEKIKVFPYIFFAVLVAALILLLQYFFLKGRKSLSQILEKKISSLYLIVCGLGYINLYNYLGGVEGNVFGFLFFLPMAMGSVVIIANEAKVFYK